MPWRTQQLKFSLWLERRGVRDAIMGVLGVQPEEESETLGRKTTYFGSEIRKKLKQLGVVKSVGERYGDVIRDIENGVTIAELIRKVGR